MEPDSHRQRIDSLPFGKRLPGAIYVFRPGPDDISAELFETIRRAEIAAQPDAAWNLLKIHTDQCAFTFLSYPEFDTDPHPALAKAFVRTDYRSRAAPLILHRKEMFLPTDPRFLSSGFPFPVRNTTCHRCPWPFTKTNSRG